MKKLLLISSQVARGCVGATAMQFALQRLGIEVWSLPAIILSNHHGHAHFAGARMKPGQLRPMLEALEFNAWLEEVDAVVTGFLPSAEHVHFAAEAVDLVRAARPGALYLCDPALGDDPKGLYVDRQAAETLRMELLPRADITTPNRFELEWFAARPVRNAVEAVEAIASVQDARPKGPKTVITTSVPEGYGQLCNLLVTATGRWRAMVERREEVPNGTGDLFAAFYLGHVLRGAPPKEALALATAALQILTTASAGADELSLIATQEAWAACAPAPVSTLEVPA